MRLTQYKKEILSYFTPDNLAWVSVEIGNPPFDVSGVAYLLYGMDSHNNRHQIESTRRTLEAMVRDGLLERVNVYERRDSVGHDVRRKVARYGLPGHSVVARDSEGRNGAIDGECIRINATDVVLVEGQ
ncbi:TPA: hypothetical protein ACHK02_003759 [Escherichia coli]|uniref:hypothetical protein n=1 Tax=Escherichia coli TaxID=562 RepID=UPI00053B9F21|nr:hypothetical protein [Escherichia coli]HDQ6665486.1 hypothetical protein [Escherichia coli O166:H28]HDQ6779141.1 hypothetical protein [Escherichia coli O113:H4]HDQ6882186.1 hypothetical protein [Escherichia coli O174:H8]HDQ6984446.1 hypothetical protein [Escherichia coli O113:H21]EEC8143393.1 hypothetical protein [Escherichia coli]